MSAPAVRHFLLTGVKKLPYPFNLPGQSMTFEMYEQATRRDG
jgi:hypothetical protein